MLNSKKFLERMPVPDYVFIKIDQDTRRGEANCIPKGSYIKAGQPIVSYKGEYDSVQFSSVSGQVEDYVTYNELGSRENLFVKIKTDGKQDLWEGIAPPEIHDRKAFLRAIESCGIRGIEGITLATTLQMSPEQLESLDTLVVNAAEWVQYGSIEAFVIRREAELLIDTILLAMKHFGLQDCYIGVEEDRKDAIASLGWFVKEKRVEDQIKIVPLYNECPPGSDRLLVFETTGEMLDARMQATDMGILVTNILSFYVLGYYIKSGLPLMTKLVTVIDREQESVRDILTPIGATIKDIISYCAEDGNAPSEIIVGGYNIAHLLKNYDMPLGRDNIAAIVFDGGVAAPEIPPAEQCGNCGTCKDNCPSGLYPGKIYQAFVEGNFEAIKQMGIEKCTDCGRCSYVCPDKKSPGHVIQIAKQLL